jgi:O-antigen/teichoic acid export membrane protein
MTVSEVPLSDLRASVRRGLGWKATSQVFRQLSRVVVVVILARLLDPSDFGLAAMVLAFSALILVFSDLGLGAALVQRDSLTESDRCTIFWTNVATGTALTVIGVVASWPIAAFYGEPQVQPLMAALSVSFLVTALGSTQSALLSRTMEFRALELRQMTATLAGGVVGILVALGGYGAWAIITQQIAISAVSTVLLWAFSPWRPRMTFSAASLRGVAGYGANVFAARLLFYFSRNADNLLIGRFLGPAALGAYAFAYNVMLVPLERIAAPVSEVLFPAFSRLGDDTRRIARSWLRANRVIAAISLPAMAGLIVVAPDFVQVVLGDRWSSATPVIRILAWVGLVQSLVRLNSSVLQARDRTDILLRWSLLITIVNVGAFVLGLHWGVVGVAACYAVANTALQPLNVWLTGRSVDVGVLDFARSLSGVAQATVAMTACALGARVALLELDASPAVQLVLVTVVGVVVFVAACAIRAPELRSDLELLRRRPAERIAVVNPPHTDLRP